jgi:predicted transcriptional regulator of viral defense system
MDPRWRQLHDLAMRQHGHVATRQVEQAGLTRPALHYQVRAGLLEAVARGVYRFTTFPPDEREHEAAVMLWAGIDRGVATAFSHETALRHYDLTDAFPAKLHLTVPRSFRRRPPSDVALHRAALGPGDVRSQGLLAYTAPARTFLDLLAAGFAMAPLRDAYRDAIARGLVRKCALQVDGATVQTYVDGLGSVDRADLLDSLARFVERA